LSLVGVAGVVALQVRGRRREIGVRVALGARPLHLYRVLAQEWLVVALLGVGLGVSGGLLGLRVLEAWLYGVEPVDPVSFGAVALLFVLVTVTTTWASARPGLRVHPASVLAEE